MGAFDGGRVPTGTLGIGATLSPEAVDPRRLDADTLSKGFDGPRMPEFELRAVEPRTIDSGTIDVVALAPGTLITDAIDPERTDVGPLDPSTTDLVVLDA